MKKFIVIAAMTLCVSANAQVVRNGNTFSMKNTKEVVDSTTKYTWETKEGTTKVYKTKTSFYVWKKSKKTGKMYKAYLPKEVQEIMRKEYNINKK